MQRAAHIPFERVIDDLVLLHPALAPKRLRNDFCGVVVAVAGEVANLDAEHERLVAAGVTFTAEPMDAGDTRVAVLDDTCGNLIQLYKATQ